MGRVDTGKEGEDLAVKYLLSKGYKLVERNFRTPFGEIDIIAKDKDYTVIVEVRRRISRIFGEPELSVSRKKQQRLRKLAEYYIMKIGREVPIRFDVIAIEGERIKHIENAF